MIGNKEEKERRVKMGLGRGARKVKRKQVLLMERDKGKMGKK